MVDSEMQSYSGRVFRQVALGLVLAACSTSLGCVGFLAHLGYWTGGSIVDPQYDGLEGKRVAVVCVSASSSYGSGAEAERLSRNVSSMLKQNVPDIEVVASSEVADWIDKNGWDEIDYRDVGRGVRAERVVAIDLEDFRLHEGPTLYKGRANLTVTVFDMGEEQAEIFRRTLSDVKYPVTGVYHATDMSENKFRDMFLSALGRQIGRYFFAYDALEESGRDAIFAG